MKFLTVLLLCLLMAVPAHTETLPDAPSSTTGSRAIFWGVALGAVGTTMLDEHVTVDGIYHSHGGCYEAHGNPYPSPASLYAKNLAITGAAIGAGYLVMRLPAFKGHPKLAALVGSTFPAIVGFKHARGAYRWYTFKDGACL